MSEVKIVYDGHQANIYCQPNEKLKDIFKRFKIRLKIESKNIVYLYNGEIISDENTILSQLTSEKAITILAYDSNNIPKILV